VPPSCLISEKSSERGSAGGKNNKSWILGFENIKKDCPVVITCGQLVFLNKKSIPKNQYWFFGIDFFCGGVLIYKT